MDLYGKYQSPFGYQVGDNGIDSYGVDHSGFTLRDEIEYQTARDNRESQMMQMYNQQGITDNYPQYTTNFWGNADNNYGFGSSNISSAISAHPAMNTTPTLLQPVQTSMPQAQASAFLSNGYSNSLNNSQGFDTNTTSQPQSGVWTQQRQRAVENDMLMNSMDVLYGMNRTINGMPFNNRMEKSDLLRHPKMVVILFHLCIILISDSKKEPSSEGSRFSLFFSKN